MISGLSISPQGHHVPLGSSLQMALNEQMTPQLSLFLAQSTSLQEGQG